MLCKTQYKSPVGNLIIAANDNGIVGLWIEGQKYFLGKLGEMPPDNNKSETLNAACKWLDDYFAGRKPPISSLPLNPLGSEFAKTIWAMLCEIPYGETVTYGELAKKAAAKLGKSRMSAQAVGGAVGHNPISIIIPCHRVVGSNGSLTGYAGGIDKKIYLLTHEGADMTKFSAPDKGTAI